MTRRSRTARLAGQQVPTHRETAGPVGHSPSRASSSRPLRLAAFAVIALAVGGVAIGLIVSRLQGPGAADTTAVQVHASMGGFEPAELTVGAGQTVRIEFSSMDTPFHITPLVVLALGFAILLTV